MGAVYKKKKKDQVGVRRASWKGGVSLVQPKKPTGGDRKLDHRKGGNNPVGVGD